jgi:predicted acylesterase/phospholipase RssA
MYELGALHALEEAVDGLDLTDVWSYVGVSAGSFIAACLANGLTTRQMLAAVIRPDVGPYGLKPELFFAPAYRELASRGLMLPRLAAEALLMFSRHSTGRAVGEAISLLAQALPVGVFDNEAVRRYLARLFSTEGRTDDFRELRRRLTVVAADLEKGTAIRFGETGFDDVPISLAVQASTAVPGVYPPVRIDGRECVDGVLLKTVHASVALEQGARLVFCINPLVPVDVTAATHAGRVPENVLVRLGLPAVLSQTFRTLIHSRLEVGISRYASRFPDADIILLEPRSDEYAMFFSNIFSFRTRVAICERGYTATRQDLLARYDEIAPVVRSHGLVLRADVLADESRDLWDGLGLRPDRAWGQRPQALNRLDRVLTALEREAEADARPTARRTRPAARVSRSR